MMERLKRLQKRDWKECNKVFVYGTLKKGYGNHYLLENAEFLGEGFTAGKFLLYNVGFPYAIPVNSDCENGYRLKGELYKVDFETFLRLDRLEGYPEHYKRKIIVVEWKDKDGKWKRSKAWIYYVKFESGESIDKVKYNEELGIEYKEWEGWR
jgi:gamma-glutamylcyclotransferase (GGCT)/AIG2-like uncharacterized protein YtfP